MKILAATIPTSSNTLDRMACTAVVLGPPLSSDIEELYPDEEYPIGVAK